MATRKKILARGPVQQVPANKKIKNGNVFPVNEIGNYMRDSIGYICLGKAGDFSIDKDNNFHNDDSQMRSLHLPDRLENLKDLNISLEGPIGDYTNEESSLDKLLEWIIKNKKKISRLFPEKYSSELDTSEKKKIDFICNRKVVTSIASTVYRIPRSKDHYKTSDWLIYATKFQSVIYLCTKKTEEEKEKEISKDENMKRINQWGTLFERYITRPKTESPNENYFAVIRGKVNNCNILFCAEMDAVDPASLSGNKTDPSSMTHFVEIKTTELRGEKNKTKINKNNIDDLEMNQTFRWKLLDWFLQCSIAGVPRVICGFRDENCILKGVKIYEVNELPLKAKGPCKKNEIVNFTRKSGKKLHKGNYVQAMPTYKAQQMKGQPLWSQTACWNFTAQFLNYVQGKFVGEEDKVVFKFHFIAKDKKIICEEGTEEDFFLSNEYIEEIKAS